jgi:hypothetical protein
VTDHDAQVQQRAIKALWPSSEDPAFPFKTFTVWGLLADLIALGVILAMFRVCTTPFETVVIAGLILLYNRVLSSVVSIGRASLDYALDREVEFVHLLRLLNDPEAHRFEEDIKEAARIVRSRKANVPYHIDSVFRAVTSLIALWKLAAAIWPQ